MHSIQASVSALAWSFLLLFFIMLAAGMFINQVIYTYFDDLSEPEHERKVVFNYFGTYIQTMITMFELTLGNWVPCCRTLMTHISQWWGLFIVIYRCFFCFAIVNVIRAVFITETNRIASSDDEVAMMNKERSGKAYTKKLKILFSALDKSGDGLIEYSDFHDGLSDKNIYDYLGTLELDPGDLENLFFLLDDGDGRVDADEFISGVNGLKGMAKSIDVATLLRMTKDLDTKITEVLTVEKDLVNAVAKKNNKKGQGSSETKKVGSRVSIMGVNKRA